jgi:RNA polymerase-binding transcription factor DksA
MSGYGSPDDESLRAMLLVEERVALSRAMLPKGKGSPTCLDCGTIIPLARQQAMPGTCHCVDCQAQSHDNRPRYKQPWAT